MSKTVIIGIVVAILGGVKLIVPPEWHPLIDNLITMLMGGGLITARMAISKASKGEEV